MMAADVFVELLHARLCLSQHQPAPPTDRDAVYWCDPVFEAVADLHDAVVAFAGQGSPGPGAGANMVREQALQVAQLACQLWLRSTGGLPLETEGEDERDE
jgi:hypothetical protein